MRRLDRLARWLAPLDHQERLTVQQSIRPKVCVLLPAYNEERHIEQCLLDTREAFPDALIVVVDNNSHDDTATIATRMGVKVAIEMSPGKGRAISHGVRLALAAGCDWIAFHDADNEYNARHLATLVGECIAQGSAMKDSSGLVMGVGLREVSLGRVLWRSILANCVARAALKLALRRSPPSDILTGSRVISAPLAQKLFHAEEGKAPYKGFELETALTRKALSVGATMICAPVRYTPRAVSEKKIKAWDMLGILKAAWHG